MGANICTKIDEKNGTEVKPGINKKEVKSSNVKDVSGSGYPTWTDAHKCLVKKHMPEDM